MFCLKHLILNRINNYFNKEFVNLAKQFLPTTILLTVQRWRVYLLYNVYNRRYNTQQRKIVTTG